MPMPATRTPSPAPKNTSSICRRCAPRATETTMRILRAADHKVMPWKNGLGATTEIAISPERDGLGDFAWRVSMAQVANDGPFSSFPGIDRTLLVLAGCGMMLDVDGRPTVTLTRDSPPHAFA